MKVHEELSAALKSAEESLLELKRSRLLREIDLVLDVKANESKSHQIVFTVDSGDADSVAEPPFLVGSKCRFRHGDGRWYYGQIMEFDHEGCARVSFLTPTTEKMQVLTFNWLVIVKICIKFDLF